MLLAAVLPAAGRAPAEPYVLASALQPDREQARRWALEELAEGAYAQRDPVSRLLAFLQQLVTDLIGGRSGDGVWWQVLLLVLLVVLVAVALRVAGPLRLGRRRADDGAPQVFGAGRSTALEHRARADAHAAAGRWAEAVAERFRAVARSLEERGLLDEGPGRTAREVAVDVAALLPTVADELAVAAGGFDDVVYGDRRAGPEQDARMRELDVRVAAATPVRAQTAGRR